MDPIDLKTIATKIRDGDYNELAGLEEDINLMCKNAQSFNEPGSQIYKDARNILKIVRTKKGELEAVKAARQAPEGKARRVSRSRLQANKKHFSSEVIHTMFSSVLAEWVIS